jgi:hypothetical protein
LAELAGAGRISRHLEGEKDRHNFRLIEVWGARGA